MPASLSLVGQRFGRLTVSSRAVNDPGKNSRWLCRCDCGNERVVIGSELRRGRTSSCGCYRNDRIRDTTGTHGMRHSVEYKAWHNMKLRCYSESRRDYKYYGGRGISVCERWLSSFEDFYADIGPRPSNKHSIDRRDTNGNYEPKNCYWATKTEQAINRRNMQNNTSGVRGVSFHSESRKWCAHIGVNGKHIHLGLFNTLNEAESARADSEIKYYGRKL